MEICLRNGVTIKIGRASQTELVSESELLRVLPGSAAVASAITQQRRARSCRYIVSTQAHDHQNAGHHTGGSRGHLLFRAMALPKGIE